MKKRVSRLSYVQINQTVQLGRRLTVEGRKSRINFDGQKERESWK